MFLQFLLLAMVLKSLTSTFFIVQFILKISNHEQRAFVHDFYRSTRKRFKIISAGTICNGYAFAFNAFVFCCCR